MTRFFRNTYTHIAKFSLLPIPKKLEKTRYRISDDTIKVIHQLIQNLLTILSILPLILRSPYPLYHNLLPFILLPVNFGTHFHGLSGIQLQEEIVLRYYFNYDLNKLNMRILHI